MILNIAEDIKFKSQNVQHIYLGTESVWGRIPEGYTECEYLENNGVAWIKTDIVPKLGLWLEVKFMYGSPKGTRTILSSESSSSGASFIVLPALYADRECGAVYVKYFTDGAASQVEPTAQELTQPIVLRFSGGSGEYKVSYYNDTYITKLDEKWKTKTQSTDSLWLFNRQRLTTSLGDTRIYYVRSPSFNLVPCLDTDSNPCFYDTIGQKTYYNAGSGTFSYKVKE